MIGNFLDYLQFEKRYSTHTIKFYKQDLNYFLIFIKSENPDSEIQLATDIDVRNYLVFLTKKEYSKRTINRKISSLRSFFKYLFQIGEIQVVPLKNIKLLKSDKNTQIPLSKEEMNKLFDNKEIFSEDFEGLRDKLILFILYTTGIRRAELVGLTWKSIDFDKFSLTVLGKRNKERIIPLLPETLLLISKYKVLYIKIFPNQFDFLFKNDDGKRITESFVYKIVNSYLRIVTVKTKVSPHILRHTFATHLLSSGAELMAIKELLGHSSLSSTQVYAHANIGDLKKVFNRSHPRGDDKN